MIRILKIIKGSPELYMSPMGREKLTHHEVESRMIFVNIPGITKEEIVFRKAYELSLIEDFIERNQYLIEVEEFLKKYNISRFLGLKMLSKIAKDIVKLKNNKRTLYTPF